MKKVININNGPKPNINKCMDHEFVDIAWVIKKIKNYNTEKYSY